MQGKMPLSEGELFCIYLPCLYFGSCVVETRCNIILRAVALPWKWRPGSLRLAIMPLNVSFWSRSETAEWITRQLLSTWVSRSVFFPAVHVHISYARTKRTQIWACTLCITVLKLMRRIFVLCKVCSATSASVCGRVELEQPSWSDAVSLVWGRVNSSHVFTVTVLPFSLRLPASSMNFPIT